jgi:hypothetical protein
MDRQTSQWSHAAIITDWAGEPANARGVEVTLQPAQDATQVPERNGVTAFRLRRYLDGAHFPNIGLCVPTFRKPKKGEDEISLAKEPDERRRLLVASAVSPNRDRERYPLWDLLAPWAHYAYAPDTAANPLLEGRPLPSAALCEYAYEAIGADLTPGATGNHTSPELLYATMKHWEGGLEQMAFVSLALFTLVRDEHGTPPEALSLDVSGTGAKAGKASAKQKAGKPARKAKKKTPASKKAARKATSKKKSRRKARG